MIRGLSPLRGKRRTSLKTKILAVVLFSCFCVWTFPARRLPVGVLTQKHVLQNDGVGGRWYIPPSWLRRGQEPLGRDASILDAAERALDLALSNKMFMNNTRIPLIAHQTWKTLDATSWTPVLRKVVEQWIDMAVGVHTPDKPEMAWFLWDDDGIDVLLKKYEPAFYDKFRLLPRPVEKADVFRVVVAKWFGGVYADVDCQLIKHPFEWVREDDLRNWTQPLSHTTHELYTPSKSAYVIPSDAPEAWRAIMGSHRSKLASAPTINAIFGIEADNPPAPDSSYWRMGYTYPVQLTNWALAMAPQHPVATQFLHTLANTIRGNEASLMSVDPLDITGPPALTAAVQAFAHRHSSPDLNWDALSGRGDPPGGRGKVIAGDTLILPITAFSPGRGRFHNMGSQSIKHENARLIHVAAGSWRKFDLRVELGKFCRTSLGLCRDWSKISE